MLQEQTVRLLNCMSSYALGRSYLLRFRGAGLVGLLYGVLVSAGGVDSPSRQHALGALQKFSLSRPAQTLMVRLGVMQWCVTHVLLPCVSAAAHTAHTHTAAAPEQRDASRAISAYSLEYGTALLMNLSLRTSGKLRCEAMLHTGEDILPALLGCIRCVSELQFRTYVNGTLYSLLSRRRLRVRARELGLVAALKEASGLPDATTGAPLDDRVQQQFDYILRLLATHDDSDKMSATSAAEPEATVLSEDDEDDEEGAAATGGAKDSSNASGGGDENGGDEEEEDEQVADADDDEAAAASAATQSSSLSLSLSDAGGGAGGGRGGRGAAGGAVGGEAFLAAFYDHSHSQSHNASEEAAFASVPVVRTLANTASPPGLGAGAGAGAGAGPATMHSPLSAVPYPLPSSPTVHQAGPMLVPSAPLSPSGRNGGAVYQSRSMLPALLESSSSSSSSFASSADSPRRASSPSLPGSSTYFATGRSYNAGSGGAAVGAGGGAGGAGGGSMFPLLKPTTPSHKGRMLAGPATHFRGATHNRGSSGGAASTNANASGSTNSSSSSSNSVQQPNPNNVIPPGALSALHMRNGGGVGGGGGAAMRGAMHMMSKSPSAPVLLAPASQLPMPIPRVPNAAAAATSSSSLPPPHNASAKNLAKNLANGVMVPPLGERRIPPPSSVVDPTETESLTRYYKAFATRAKVGRTPLSSVFAEPGEFDEP